MEITIDRASEVPIYMQIVQRIREMIVAGRLPAGFQLPPERKLSENLGVNRSTVLNAYRYLKANGLVDAHVGRGTAVLPQNPPSSPIGSIQALPWRQLFRDSSALVKDPSLRDVLALTERSEVLPLAVGLPAPELMPIQTMQDMLANLLREHGAKLLLHCPTEGHSPFRLTLSQWLTSRGVRCSASEVLILSGSQQGLDLAARVFCNPGDTVVVEEPSFFGALQAFRSNQARLLGVPVDDEGMRTDALAALLQRHRPKFIYTLPTFQNPTGAVMSLERRQQLLELAYRHQIPILEDDPYAELRYEGERLPSLKTLDTHGYVISLSTFSKILFPGLRLGWLVAPRPVLRQFVLAKQALDLHSSTIGQYVLDRFISEGHMEPHLAKVRKAYSHRLVAMDESLRTHAPAGLVWNKPEGGFYLWCRLPNGVDRTRLLRLAGEAAIAFLPGRVFFVDEPYIDYARFNFSFPSTEQIREGISRFCSILRLAASPGIDDDEATATLPIV